MTQIQIEAKPLSQEQLLAHENAVACAKRFRLAEKDLLFAIMEVDRLLIYQEFGEAYLTPYCIKYLKLSEDVAGYFVRVGRKAAEIPALKHALLAERISMTRARIIASVLTAKNCEEWIRKAETMSKTGLEAEVAKCSPEHELPELVKPVGVDRVRIRMDLSKDSMSSFVRARQLLSEKKRQNLNYGAALMVLVADYLKRKDPTFHKQKTYDPPQGGWPKLSAQLKRAVHQRDKGRCQAILPDGKQCGSTRWVQLHHIKPRSEGGEHSLKNLTTLCSSHHRQWHKSH